MKRFPAFLVCSVGLHALALGAGWWVWRAFDLGAGDFGSSSGLSYSIEGVRVERNDSSRPVVPKWIWRESTELVDAELEEPFELLEPSSDSDWQEQLEDGLEPERFDEFADLDAAVELQRQPAQPKPQKAPIDPWQQVDFPEHKDWELPKDAPPEAKRETAIPEGHPVDTVEPIEAEETESQAEAPKLPDAGEPTDSTPNEPEPDPKSDVSSDSKPGPPAVTPATPLHQPQPDYPKRSRRMGEQGTVRCRLHIASDGKVLRVEILEPSKHPRLDQAARETLLTWNFRPAQQSASAIPSTYDHDVVFRLR